jgi:hypothetical protein
MKMVQQRVSSSGFASPSYLGAAFAVLLMAVGIVVADEPKVELYGYRGNGGRVAWSPTGEFGAQTDRWTSPQIELFEDPGNHVNGWIYRPWKRVPETDWRRERFGHLKEIESTEAWDTVRNRLGSIFEEYNEHAMHSPNGKRIVWMSGRENLKGSTDYWSMNLDGSNKVRLTDFNNPDLPTSENKSIISETFSPKRPRHVASTLRSGPLPFPPSAPRQSAGPDPACSIQRCVVPEDHP